MAEEIEEAVDAVLCFDANLPRMHTCSHRCVNSPLVLCRHRFNFNAELKYYNTNQFRGWPDSKILLHVLDYAKDYISCNSGSAKTLFAILTKDIDFLKDAEGELSRKNRRNDLVFLNNFVTSGDIIICVQLLDCKNYGSKKLDNLKCAIHKMNKLFGAKRKS